MRFFKKSVDKNQCVEIQGLFKIKCHPKSTKEVKRVRTRIFAISITEKIKFQGFNQTVKIKDSFFFFAFLHNWTILKSLKIFNGLPPKGWVTHPTKNLGLNRIYQIVQIASVCLSYRHDCVLPPAVSPNLRL